jgi:hypothetical protein
MEHLILELLISEQHEKATSGNVSCRSDADSLKSLIWYILYSNWKNRISVFT